MKVNMKVNLEEFLTFPSYKMKLVNARIVWTWPTWLRLFERMYRRMTGRWEVSYEFEVINN